jgi:molecular chaperone GrpE
MIYNIDGSCGIKISGGVRKISLGWSLWERKSVMQQGQPQNQNTSTSQQVDEPPIGQNETDTVAELTQKLEAIQRKSEEYLDMLQRTQADFINYKRRISQEQNESRIAAQSAVLSQILPVLDDLGRALQAVPPELTNNAWVQGILLLSRRLQSVLEQLGVQQVGKAGEPFNPRLHEAMSTESREDVPEGNIVQVTRPGYVIGERVIRPAQVIVAGPPSIEVV